MNAPILSTLDPTYERRRIEALLGLDILDTPEEPEFDELVHLASEICSTPVSTITLVDSHRQWFKASIGVTHKENPRNISFCAQAIQQPNLFLVENAATDPRFRNNVLVTSAPGIRFYAGVPLLAPNGMPVGTLCVIDMVPRTLSASQKNALMILSRQVKARMELRAKQKSLELALKEKSELAKHLEISTTLFQTFVNNNPNICYFKSEDGKYLSYNTRFAEQFGIGLDDWVGKSDAEVLPKELAEVVHSHDALVLASNGVHEISHHVASPGGAMIWLKSLKFPIRIADGSTILAGVDIDVTREVEKEHALSEANAMLELLATTDNLTALSNRRVFEERTMMEFGSAVRNARQLSLLLMDIDDFKKRNDTFGHAAGDEALRMVGHILREGVRMEDMAARIGGEEFAILLPDTSLEKAVLVAERIQNELRRTDAGPLPLTVSIGIAAAIPHAESWERLVSRADKAMYEAKRTGKNRIVVSDGYQVPVAGRVP